MKKLILVMLFLGMVGFAFAQPSVQVEPGTNIVSGKTTVSAANTATVLGSNQAILSVSISGIKENVSSWVYIGSSSLTTNNGIVLTSGSILKLEVNNLNKVYFISPNTNDSVGYVAVVR